MSVALYSSVSGLVNFQRVLDITGNNIANMSTPGYKKSHAAFREAITQVLEGASSPGSGIGGTNPLQIGLGTQLGAVNINYSQGLLETTGRATDLAITGNGFFVTGTGNDRVYTRNGNFSLDVDGNLVASNGYYVLGWESSGGTIPAGTEPTSVNIPLGIKTIARATENVYFKGNLDSTQAVYNAGPPETGGKFVSEYVVYDSLGRAQTMTITVTKQASPAAGQSQWNYDLVYDGASVSNGTLIFDSDGKFDAAASTVPAVTISPGDGANDVVFNLNFDDASQVSTPDEYSLVVNNQDGLKAGTLQSFSVDQNGFVVGSFDNGMTQVIAQVAIADFVNPEGLEREEGGFLRETMNSGVAQIGAAGTASRGTLSNGTLELSNVDLSSEFTNMIIAQRAFQANSRVVSVVDQMLEELANLKR